MEIAARILGVEVGSTEPRFLAVLAVHVLAGLVAVLTGAAAGFSRKGSGRHVAFGRWFYWAIGVAFGTALVLTVMRPRENLHLAALGTAAFLAATIGYLHRRRHRPGDTPHIVGMGAAYIVMLTAFYVDNGPNLPVWDRLPPIVFWFLPAAIGMPIIVRAVRRTRD